MKNSKSEMDVNVERFTNAIQKKWNREADRTKIIHFPVIFPLSRAEAMYMFLI